MSAIQRNLICFVVIIFLSFGANWASSLVYSPVTTAFLRNDIRTTVASTLNSRAAGKSGRPRVSSHLSSAKRSYGSDGDRKRRKMVPVAGDTLSIGGIDLSMTNLLLAINIAVFMAIQKFPILAMKLMKYDALIARGQTYRLVTSTFAHQSAYHLLANCMSLHQIGPMADRLFGPGRYLATYIAAGTLANSATYLMKTSPASLGASGSTFGLIGAFAYYFYRNREILGSQSEAMLESIKRTVLMNLFYGFAVPQIDNMGHIFGFLSGALFTYAFGPRLSVVTRPSGRRGLVDKPLVPFMRYWRRFLGWGRGGNGSGDDPGPENLFYTAGGGRRRPKRPPLR